MSKPNARKGGLFGQFAPGQASLMPAQEQAPVMGQAPTMAPEQPKKGFLGGGWAETLAGTVGDWLMQANGMQPVYAPFNMQMNRQRQQAEAAQAQREADWQDWQKQFDYKANWDLQHPDQKSHYWESNDGSLMQIGPNGQPQKVYQDPDPRMNFIPDGMGGGQWVPVPTSGSAPIKPVGKLTPIGGPTPSASGGFPVNADYGRFKSAIIGQESGGRYGVANTEGSGAMGVGQIMPDTARSLARQAGLPYRPDLMAGSGPDARAYQDRLTEAAVKEAWAYGKGNPQLAAYYYFAGPDKAKWGPKTRQYGTDILQRIARGK